MGSFGSITVSRSNGRGRTINMKFIAIMLVLICLTSGCRCETDPFGPTQTQGDKAPLYHQIFVINHKEGGFPVAKDVDLNGLSEVMDGSELQLMRFMQKNGVDFISVDGSYVTIPDASRKLYLSRPFEAYCVIITQTKENIELSATLLKRFDGKAVGSLVETKKQSQPLVLPVRKVPQ